MHTSNRRFASSAIRDLLDQARRPDVISLAGGLPADELLPIERLDRAWNEVIGRHGAASLQYGPSVGEPALIEALALAEQRDPAELVITSGSQQALDLVLSVLEADGDPRSGRSGNLAAVEHPGYVGALQAMRARRYTLLPIPVDHDGMVVDALGEALADGARPRLCYVNPSFQNPTGASLTPARGAELIRLAEHYGFVVISDDPYAELHLDGPRRDPIPDSDHLVRLGSMSKTLAPGLRIGWAAAPAAIHTTMVLAKQAGDLHTATPNQLVAADIVSDERWWREHCAALREGYRYRRSALRDALAGSLPDLAVTEQHGGFFLWLPLPHESNAPAATVADSTAAAQASLDAGVAVVPGAAFAADSDHPPPALRLSYSSADPARFVEAVERLASTF